jgi:hypothetical protein
VWGLLELGAAVDGLRDYYFLPRSLEGWLNVLARLIATVVIAWGLLIRVVHGKVAVERKEREAAITGEAAARQLADIRIEERVASIATDVHTQMGKFELLREQLHQADKDRIRELEHIRKEMSTGFAHLKGMLRSRGYVNHREHGDDDDDDR